MQGAASSAVHCGSKLVGAPEDAAALELSQNVDKAHALGNALLVALVVPWSLCFIIYSGMLQVSVKIASC